jgi:hypothetical protein
MTLVGDSVRSARAAVEVGVRLGRSASAAAVDAAGRTALVGLDALLGWRYTDEAARRVLDSPAADRAVDHALEGPLVEAVAHGFARHAVMERVADELLAGDALEGLLARMESAKVPARVTERVLADGIAQEITERLIEGPELERLTATVLESPRMQGLIQDVVDSPALERAAAHAIESRLIDIVLDGVLARLTEREELWVLVDEIAGSPAVMEAISQQGRGFADQVAGQVRVRSQRADARLERVARQLLRRPPATDHGDRDGEGP